MVCLIGAAKLPSGSVCAVFLARFHSMHALDCPSLLITDDDRGFRETLAEVFRQRGYRTLLAADGEEALTIVKAEEVHLVLLDMHMPKLTGLETLQRVRLVRASLPCILITAGLDDRILAEARAARVVRVLAKPISCSKVTATVSDVLQLMYHWRDAGEHGRGTSAGNQRPPSAADLSNPGG